jgi:hypothetical protein
MAAAIVVMARENESGVRSLVMPPPRLLRFGGVIANDGSSAVRYIEHRTTKRENDVFGSYGQAKSLSNAEHMGLFLSRNALNLFQAATVEGRSFNKRAMGLMPPNRRNMFASCVIHSTSDILGHESISK